MYRQCNTYLRTFSSSVRQAYLHVLEAVRLQGSSANRGRNYLCVGESGEQLLEQHPDFTACKVRAHAKVRTAGAETLVWVWIPCNVEIERIGEALWVTICRDKPHPDLLPLFHFDAFEVDVLGQNATHMLDRRRPADNLFGHRPFIHYRIVDEQAALVRELRERQHPL